MRHFVSDLLVALVIVPMFLEASAMMGRGYWRDGNYWQRLCASNPVGLYDFMDGVADGVGATTNGNSA